MAETRIIQGPGGSTMVQTDYVERGSDEHAAGLGLRKWREGDPTDLKVEGWTFVDITQFGPLARPEFIKAVLTQRVAELGKEPIEVRETQGRSRAYTEKGKTIIEAPPMFDPRSGRRAE